MNKLTLEQINEFSKWLIENSNHEMLLSACINEALELADINGTEPFFELLARDSKSGKPESYSF